MPSVITPCGDASGIVFDKTPQTGGFLVITTLTGTITIADKSGNGLFLLSDDGAGSGGFVSIATEDGEVFVKSTSIVNRLSNKGGATFEVQYPDATRYLRMTDTGFVTLRLLANRPFTITDPIDTELFVVHGDGNVDMPLLPTSDPGVPGRLWNDLGTVKISL